MEVEVFRVGRRGRGDRGDREDRGDCGGRWEVGGKAQSW